MCRPFILEYRRKVLLKLCVPKNLLRLSYAFDNKGLKVIAFIRHVVSV